MRRLLAFAAGVLLGFLSRHLPTVDAEEPASRALWSCWRVEDGYEVVVTLGDRYWQRRFCVQSYSLLDWPAELEPDRERIEGVIISHHARSLGHAA